MSSLTKRIMKTTTTTTSSASSRIIGGDEEPVDDAGGGGGEIVFRRAGGPPNQRLRGFDSTASTGDGKQTLSRSVDETFCCMLILKWVLS